MAPQGLKKHWDGVYAGKPTDQVSWFRPHLDTSLALIRETGVATDAPIIDVGGGPSTLVDDLLDAGYEHVTVLDVSAAALDLARARLGARATRVSWLADDVTRATLPAARYRVWHDRAVFHFLTDTTDRERYVAQVRHAVSPGGFVIVGTFGPDGPQRCSGLPTARYDADGLHDVFGDQFRLLRHLEERHVTPGGTAQQFVYCLCRLG